MKWLLLASSIFCGAFGQLCMKAGMQAIGQLDSFWVKLLAWAVNPEPAPEPVFGLLWLLAGIFFYALAMLVWVYVLKHFELSVAYPLLSVGYIIVYLGAVLWPRIGETFTWDKTWGVLLIMLGVALVATPTKANNHE